MDKMGFILLAAGMFACAGCTTETSREQAVPVVRYVSTAGSDSAAGTEDAPWKTIQRAVDSGGAGVTVLVRGGVYNERVTLGKGGSPKGFMTLRSYPGERAVLDGTALPDPESSPSAMIMIDGLEYVKVEGFEIRNFRTESGDQFPAGIFVIGESSHIELRGNIVHDIANETGDGESGAHGIAVYGTSKKPMTDITVADNEIYGCRLGWSEALVLNGNVDGFSVTGNYVHDNDNIGIDFIGHEGECPDPALDQARNGVCSGNRVVGIDTRMAPRLSAGESETAESEIAAGEASSWNPAYGGSRSADGIYVDGGKDIVIERNVVDFCNIGIELASEHSGKTTSGVTVRNNLITNSHTCGIAFGGYDEERGSTENCRILNNTLYNNSTDPDQMGSVCVQFDTRNNEFRNNIVYDLAGSGLVANDYEQNRGNLFGGNLYWTVGDSKSLWRWKGVEYRTLDSFTDATGDETPSVFADPLFIDAAKGDFRLAALSPAIDSGGSASGSGDLDMDSNSRTVSVIDIGAFEAQ